MRPSTRMGEPAALQLPPVESHRDKSAVAYGPDTEVASTPLCQRCQYIDFEKAFGNTGRSARPLYRGGRDIACLGRILAPDESCPLCRLLSTYAEEDVAYPKVSNASYYLYAFRGIDTYNADPMKECLEQGSNILGLCKGSYSDVGERTRRHEWWRRGPLGVIGPESSGTRAMPIDMFKIDADRARGWINSCISDHTKCSRGEGIWPPHPIQCIDCNTREIATIAFGAKYCALSYVWGASSMHDSRSNSFPRTVLDAVKVTLDLGFTYLWVDQYCINQSKSEQKKAQIQQMGDIYRCAALTLIAAAGENADAGLVGVSRPRTRQQRSRIEAADVVLLPPALPHVLESSVWNTRGWTYQEAVL